MFVWVTSDFYRFRWAQCQIAALRQLKDRRPKTVKLVLSRMPEDLYSYYEITVVHLCQIDETTSVSNGELVYRILLFVAFSGRPVTVAEAAEFAIIEGSRTQTNVENRFEDPMAILSFLGTLVSTQDSILTLAHKSVKDFLESPRAQSGPLQIRLFLERHNQCTLESETIGHAADLFIARVCLGYLSTPHLAARQTMSTDVTKDPNTSYLGKLNKENALMDYAARMWPFHLRESALQQNAKPLLYDALHPNEQGQATLWQGWLFLQPADIWERQLWLAGFLCECFVRSSLLDGWADNFWYSRQTYRVVNSPCMPVEAEKPRELDSQLFKSQLYKNAKNVLVRVSKQYFDLAILLLEIGLQRPLYSQHQEELFAAGTASTIDAYIKYLEQLSKSVIPRMGEGYHKAVYGCIQHIMVEEEKPLVARPMFEKQTEVMDTILQPLRSSAASGFRRSQSASNSIVKNLRALHPKDWNGNTLFFESHQTNNSEFCVHRQHCLPSKSLATRQKRESSTRSRGSVWSEPVFRTTARSTSTISTRTTTSRVIYDVHSIDPTIRSKHMNHGYYTGYYT